VVGVDVNSRDEIIPTFRIPATPVRVMDRVVGLGEQKSNRVAEFGWRPFTL